MKVTDSTPGDKWGVTFHISGGEKCRVLPYNSPGHKWEHLQTQPTCWYVTHHTQYKVQSGA